MRRERERPEEIYEAWQKWEKGGRGEKEGGGGLRDLINQEKGKEFLKRERKKKK
jgi:hypothetical protein